MKSKFQKAGEMLMGKRRDDLATNMGIANEAKAQSRLSSNSGISEVVIDERELARIRQQEDFLKALDLFSPRQGNQGAAAAELLASPGRSSNNSGGNF